MEEPPKLAAEQQIIVQFLSTHTRGQSSLIRLKGLIWHYIKQKNNALKGCTTRCMGKHPERYTLNWLIKEYAVASDQMAETATNL